MKQAIALGLCALMVGAVDVAADARPKRTARQVVAAPRLPLSRKGGLPTRPVDRGVSRDDRGIRPAALPGFGRSPLAAVSKPHTHLPVFATPARAQVLAIRERVRIRYQGRGKGSRLALEIP